MSKCLYCYKELEDGQLHYHPVCAKKLFGSPVVLELPYTRDDIEELADEVVRSQTTVTGVQAKLSLDVAQEKSNEPKRFTIVGLWGRYILKPQTPLFTSLPEVEDLTMHLAEIAKIKVVPHGLIPFQDGELCYITRRIDRADDGTKYPMEDMCQLTERLTEYKYKGSYEQIAKHIHRYAKMPVFDLGAFWEVVLFSWLTGNADMHLKNFSLYSKKHGEYSLTPAYDLVSTALVMPEDTEELALNLCGKKRKLKRKDFETAMQQSGMNDKAIENIFKRFIACQPKWEAFIRNSFLSLEMQEQYIAIIAERIGRCTV